MKIELYVYDLSKGMARAMSRSFLGIQIDAVYHTSVVFENVEYLFGAGVQTCRPGSSHHGQPMEIVPLGETQLPLEVILEYLESLKQIYTPESYDLFTHNCNNFSHDFSLFLTGKGIPEHITSLPQTVLNTPFGQMLRPQLEASMRTVTQAPIPQQTQASASEPLVAEETDTSTEARRVHSVSQPAALEQLLSAASASCAVIFFTSSTCAPCKLAYPTYDTLASQHAEATFVKVDINRAGEVASKYQIRATPTFMTFLRGTKDQEWTGADPGTLRGHVGALLQRAFPPHPHTRVKAPSFAHGSLRPVLFSKTPPLDKLVQKMGASASNERINELVDFIRARSAQGAMEAPLPDMAQLAGFLQSAPAALDSDSLFSVYDLLRCAMIDPRVSGWFAEEGERSSCPATSTTLAVLLSHVADAIGKDECAYSLHLVALQLCGNIFSSPLGTRAIMARDSDLANTICRICIPTLTGHGERKPALGTAVANLAFNLAVTSYRARREERGESLPESLQFELCAGLLEAIGREEQDDGMRINLLAMGFLLYYTPPERDIWDLCRAMNARDTVQGIKTSDKATGAVRDDLCALLVALDETSSP